MLVPVNTHREEYLQEKLLYVFLARERSVCLEMHIWNIIDNFSEL